MDKLKLTIMQHLERKDFIGDTNKIKSIILETLKEFSTYSGSYDCELCNLKATFIDKERIRLCYGCVLTYIQSKVKEGLEE